METKKEFRYFSIMDHEKEQEYLRQQHKSGWKFVSVTGIGTYQFEKCDPEDVVYQLDYNREGMTHKEEYIQMFKDCGWTYLQEFYGYSYFSKPAAEMKQEEEIFCDDSSRLEMMERVFKGRLLPMVIIFTALLLPQFINHMAVTHNYAVGASLGGIIGLYMAVFAAFAWKYHKYKEKVKK